MSNFLKLNLDKQVLIKRTAARTFTLEESKMPFDTLELPLPTGYGLFGAAQKIVKIFNSSIPKASTIFMHNNSNEISIMPFNAHLPILESVTLHPTHEMFWDEDFSSLESKILNNKDLIKCCRCYFIVECEYPGIVSADTEITVGTFRNSFIPSTKSIQVNSDFIIKGKRGSGKSIMLKEIAESIGFHVFMIPAYDFCSSSLKTMKKNLVAKLELASAHWPCIISFTHIDLVKETAAHFFVDIISDFKRGENIFIAVLGYEIDSAIEKHFEKHFSTCCPDKETRRQMIERVEQNCNVAVSLSNGSTLGEVQNLIKSIRVNGYDDAIKAFKKRFTGSSIPNVSWSDVGGLHDAKRITQDQIELPLKYAEAFKKTKILSGMLLYGPPGTGKTLLAKAIATSMSLNFISVKGPEILSMYYGESEENIRKIFEKARAASPSVIFFDEIDSIASARNAKGVMDRVTSQLMVEMDSLDQVFVIGATNRLDLIDPSLLRAGRFDTKIFLGLPTQEEKQEILEAQMKNIDYDFDLSLIDLSKDLSGAEIYSMVADAVSASIQRQISDFKAECELNGQDMNQRLEQKNWKITLTLKDFQ